MNYYSVTLSIICIVDDGTIPESGYIQDIQVRIIKAHSFKDALQKALILGKEKEHHYRNENGHNVYWKLKEIEYVRKLGKELNGLEVSTRLENLHINEPYDKNTIFSPEKSEPIMDEES